MSRAKYEVKDFIRQRVALANEDLKDRRITEKTATELKEYKRELKFIASTLYDRK
jgi:hypothetical protein